MSEKEKQIPLLVVDPGWKKQWQGMPDYNHEELQSEYSIKVHFRNADDRRAFGKLLDQKLSDLTKSLWFPKMDITRFADKRWLAGAQNHVPRYPIYIISKGRWESRLTSKSLEAMGLAYHICVEPQEVASYAAVIDPAKILTLPFSNLGQGSIPARNFVWEHALAAGARRHWILDDNIRGFFRFQNNLKVPVGDGSTFCAAEDFIDRYKNVAIGGFHYFMFVPRKDGSIPPFRLNTRVYSCILLDTSLPYRWRGRYNEDTDLSLRALKDGHCTILFNAFIADKMTTMTMKGGNSDELYQDDGRLKMAESLRDQHPELVEITHKFGRWQHHVNYRLFKNRLILRDDFEASEGNDNYGMELRHLDEAGNLIESEDDEAAALAEEQGEIESEGEAAATPTSDAGDWSTPLASSHETNDQGPVAIETATQSPPPAPTTRKLAPRDDDDEELPVEKEMKQSAIEFWRE